MPGAGLEGNRLRFPWPNAFLSGPGLPVSYDPRVVRTHVGRLRRKLGNDGENPTYILTEPRVGYRIGQAGNPGPAIE